MKNKGETLIESLLSIFFVAVVLTPVSNLILKTFRTDSKIDRKNIFNMETENISEGVNSLNIGSRTALGEYENLEFKRVDRLLMVIMKNGKDEEVKIINLM